MKSVVVLVLFLVSLVGSLKMAPEQPRLYEVYTPYDIFYIEQTNDEVIISCERFGFLSEVDEIEDAMLFLHNNSYIEADRIEDYR